MERLKLPLLFFALGMHLLMYIDQEEIFVNLSSQKIAQSVFSSNLYSSLLNNLSILSPLKRRKTLNNGKSKLTYLFIFLVLVTNSWDIETNPGPPSLSSSSHFPCGVCEASVGWTDRGIVCDTCNVWYHIDCQGMSSTMYSIYNRSMNQSCAWECLKCGMPNFSTSLFDFQASINLSNRFSSLSMPDSPLPDCLGSPNTASSPIAQPTTKTKRKKKANLDHPLRIILMNCQSIKTSKNCFR